MLSDPRIRLGCGHDGSGTYARCVEDARREYSVARLAELADRLEPLAALVEERLLCVYATGSYGRLEAGADSDVDLFFLCDGEEADDEFPFTSFLRVGAAVVEAAEEMRFPPFTGDGQYLEVHYVRTMERVLGSPEDDSINAFTARMLLLLESRPVLASTVYDDLLARIASFYFRDFADNAETFVPTFFNNDILRFWRTLTLNYEHKRLQLQWLEGPELEHKKADLALKNYKLKISRLLTCFSMVAALSALDAPVTPDQVLELCGKTPRERLADLARRGDGAAEIVGELEARYATFLEAVQRPKDEIATSFENPARRKAALAEANAFGDGIYELIKRTAHEDRLRYLII
jgi:predicted nucleotidyltransferase